MWNGWLGTPYYQHFVEFPRHQITMSEITNSPIGLDKRHHFVLLAEGV